jgi:hypothetical protein
MTCTVLMQQITETSVTSAVEMNDIGIDEDERRIMNQPNQMRLSCPKMYQLIK